MVYIRHIILRSFFNKETFFTWAVIRSNYLIRMTTFKLFIMPHSWRQNSVYLESDAQFSSWHMLCIMTGSLINVCVLSWD